MYPSAKDPTYGTFVKMFKEGVEKVDSTIQIKKIVIDHRIKCGLHRLFVYIPFYIKVFFDVLFGSYDLVYLHQGTHSSPPLLLARLLRNFKLVVNLHGGDVLTTNALNERLFQISKPLIRKADCIVVPSHYFMKEVIGRIPDLTEGLFFISPSGGVNSEVFRYSSKLRNSNQIVCVSRIDFGKGWETLLDAMKIVVETYPDLQCKFIGAGSLVPELLNKISFLGLEKNCIYIGALTHDQLCEEYHKADLSIFPTQLKESLGLVGIESLSCGCPVVGSNIGCLPEFILDGEDGFLVRPGDSKALSNAILTYYSLGDKQKKRIIENAHRIATKYEANIVAVDMVSHLRSL